MKKTFVDALVFADANVEVEGSCRLFPGSQEEKLKLVKPARDQNEHKQPDRKQLLLHHRV